MIALLRNKHGKPVSVIPWKVLVQMRSEARDRSQQLALSRVGLDRRAASTYYFPGRYVEPIDEAAAREARGHVAFDAGDAPVA